MSSATVAIQRRSHCKVPISDHSTQAHQKTHLSPSSISSKVSNNTRNLLSNFKNDTSLLSQSRWLKGVNGSLDFIFG